jgi:hypothetical protein
MKLFAVIAVLALSPMTVWASAPTAASLNAAHVQVLVQNLNVMDLINWKVGDTSSSNIEAFGQTLGTMVKLAEKDDGQTVWLKESMALQGQNDVVELQIDRTSGQVVKMLHNGQEEQYPNDPPQVTNQEVVDVTVPAGTFHCVHITFNTSQVQGAELWANPQQIVLDGAAKEIMPTQGIQVTIEMTSQTHGS